VSKPDPTYGEVVKSFIVLRPGHAGTDELKLDIMNFVRKHLSPVAMPHAIDFVDRLPKLAVARFCAACACPGMGDRWAISRRSTTRKAEDMADDQQIARTILDYIRANTRRLAGRVHRREHAAYLSGSSIRCRWCRSRCS